jgi:excisionase family DNA binding protein
MTLLTSAQAAGELGITKRGLHKLVERGALRATRFGNALAFTAAEVERAKSRRPPGRPPRKKRAA